MTKTKATAATPTVDPQENETIEKPTIVDVAVDADDNALVVGTWFNATNGAAAAGPHYVARVSKQYARGACGATFRAGAQADVVAADARCASCRDVVDGLSADVPSDVDDVNAYVVARIVAAFNGDSRVAWREVQPNTFIPDHSDDDDQVAKPKRRWERVVPAARVSAPTERAHTPRQPKAPKEPRAPKVAPATSVSAPKVPPAERAADTFGGKTYTATVKQVTVAIKGKAPEKIQAWAVDVNGTLYPPKQVARAVWKDLPHDINTYGCNALLRAAGLDPQKTAA